MSETETALSSGSRGSGNASRVQMVHFQVYVDDLVINNGALTEMDTAATYKCEWKLLAPVQAKQAAAENAAAAPKPDPKKGAEAGKKGADAKDAKDEKPPLEGNGGTRAVPLKEGTMLWRECFDMPCIEIGVPPIDAANRRFLAFSIYRLNASGKKEIGRVRVEVRFDDTKRKKAFLDLILQGAGLDEDSQLRCTLRINIQMAENALMRSKVMTMHPQYIRGAERGGAAAFKPRETQQQQGSSEATSKKKEEETEKVVKPVHASERPPQPGEKVCHRCKYYFKEDNNPDDGCTQHTGILEKDYSIMTRNMITFGATGLVFGAVGGGIYAGVAMIIKSKAAAASGSAVMASFFGAKSASMTQVVGIPVGVGAGTGAVLGVGAGGLTAISDAPGPWSIARYACCGTYNEKCTEARKHAEY